MACCDLHTFAVVARESNGEVLDVRPPTAESLEKGGFERTGLGLEEFRWVT